ncbi:substrate-binding periplasmic protein [Aestuariispira ectoiniformans]|uniref:substrate-binding periplasmic protein n=1 Tax=Aestuariispira ectoiniformans TaxID=2775080 RepID=UPI00223B259B|nr:transporter substrate-binding domain-containing protein [Aestuariispira ectoiniformans]
MTSIFLFAYSAQAEEPLSFACNDFPPHKIANPDDPSLPGFDVEILKAAFAQTNTQMQVHFYPWKRAMHLARKGTVTGLCSCSYRPEREEYLLFSDKMGTVSSGVFRTASVPAIDSLDDLKGRPVGVVSGYSLVSSLEEAKAAPVIALNDQAAVRMLAAHRFDYLYGFKAATEFQMRHKTGPVAIHYQETSKSNYYMCVSKRAPGAQDILDRFNQGLEAIHDNGTYQSIMDKYR